VFNYTWTWPSKWLVSPCVGLRARVAAHYKWIIYARALTTADGWGIRMWMKPLAGDPVGRLGGWESGDTTARRLSHGGLRQRPILVNAKWVVAASRWCHKREKGAVTGGSGLARGWGWGWEAVARHKLKSASQKLRPRRANYMALVWKLSSWQAAAKKTEESANSKVIRANFCLLPK